MENPIDTSGSARVGDIVWARHKRYSGEFLGKVIRVYACRSGFICAEVHPLREGKVAPDHVGLRPSLRHGDIIRIVQRGR